MLLQEQLYRLFTPFLQLILAFLNPFFLIPAIIIVIILVKKNREYKGGAYYQVTKQPYLSVKCDTGKYGEYLTYKYLKYFETEGAKFLFNVYIPKGDGETSEIDVLMLCSKGLFVFESKNYSGWIFGSESQKNWYQTLPKGRGRSHKERFYNPIMQNRSHIKHLKAFLGEQIPMRSIIVFSDRCTLKNVEIKSNDISVINRYNVFPVVSAICNHIPTELLSESDITELYDKLYPYTQVDDIAKMQHVANIYSNQNTQPIQKVASIHMFSPTQAQIECNIPSRTQTSAIEQNGVSPTILETQPIQADGNECKILNCPKCSGRLILRTAKKGIYAGNRFYGCSNYPKCKYVQNITIE